MPPRPPPSPARPPRVELSAGYFLERYFGWTLEGGGPGWKLWRRRSAGLARRLLVSDGAPRATLAGALEASPPSLLASTIWNDFADDAPSADVSLGRRRFTPAAGAARWFGVGTYVFDLAEDDEALLSRAQSRVRSKVRSTRRAGYRTEFLERPSASAVAHFAVRYTAMARERGLSPVDVEALGAMFTQGDAVLARAFDPAGVPRTWNVVYLTDSHGYYLLGVHDPSVAEPGGHQLHMETLGYVRSRGRRYYDFGLVASPDPHEGIHRFKRALGGLFLPSGVERVARAPGYGQVVGLFRRARQLSR